MSVPPTAWKDNTPIGRYAANLEGELLAGVLYPEMFGGRGNDITFDNATAITAACDAARGTGAVVSLCFNPPYWFSNVLVSANMTLKGPNMNRTCLARIPGSTGIAVREKTAAEGNASGATGLWIRDLAIRGYLATDPGAGGVGDQGTYGLQLGNGVPGQQLNFNSSVENVKVQGFGAGTGVWIYQNAAKCSYIWSNTNKIGIETFGGQGGYDNLWFEGNTERGLIIGGGGDTYSRLHSEESSVLEVVLVKGGANTIFGAQLAIGANKTSGVVTIDLANNGSATSIYGLRIVPNGFTYPHGIYVPAWATGTGPTQQIFPFWVDANSTNYAWYFDSLAGKSFRFSGSGIKEPHFSIAGDLTLEVSNTAGRGSASIAGAGAQRFDSTIGKPIWSDGTVWRDAAGTAV